MKKYILYISIFTVSAFIGYGIKTTYNGDALGMDYWIIAIILICSQVPFYFSGSQGKSTEEIHSNEEE